MSGTVAFRSSDDDEDDRNLNLNMAALCGCVRRCGQSDGVFPLEKAVMSPGNYCWWTSLLYIYTRKFESNSGRASCFVRRA